MKRVALCLLAVSLSGCMAIHTSVAKRNLDVQTRLSQTVYLAPVEPEQRTVFLDIRKTAAEYQYELAPLVAQAITDRGYTLVDSPSQAQYWLQVNVRAVYLDAPEVALQDSTLGMTSAEITQLLNPQSLATVAPIAAAGAVAANEHKTEQAPEPTVLGHERDQHDSGWSSNVSTGVYHSSAMDNVEGKDVAVAIGVLALWAGAEYLGSAMVQDKYITMVTDIQIAERVEGKVEESSSHTLKQGDSGALDQLWQRTTNRQKYQTRVVSFANQANLKWDDAAYGLHQGLTRVLSGIF